MLISNLKKKKYKLNINPERYLNNYLAVIAITVASNPSFKITDLLLYMP